MLRRRVRSAALLLAVPGALAAQGAPSRTTFLAADRALSDATGLIGFAGAVVPRAAPGFVLVWPGASVVLGAERLTAFFAGAPFPTNPG